MKKLLAFAMLLLASVSSFAQFSPGQLVTAAALNNQFSLYVPIAGGTLTGPLTVPTLTSSNATVSGGSINGTPVGATTASSGRFTTLNSSGLATLSTITAPSTGNFYAGQGGSVNRLSDRLFIAGATANNGTQVASQPDWLTTFQLSTGRNGGFIQLSDLAVLNGTNTNDVDTFVTGAQTKYINIAGLNAIGGIAVCVNNNTTTNLACYSNYDEAYRAAGALGGAYGFEIDTVNYAGSVVTDPYQQAGAQTVAMQLAAGAGLSPTGQYPSQAALNIQNNGTTFDAAMNIGSNALTSNIAIKIAKGQTLAQYYGSAGVPTGSIFGSGTTTAAGIQFQLNDNQACTVNSSGAQTFCANSALNTVNSIQVNASTAGSSPVAGAVGSDTNISLVVNGKGTGGALLQGGTSGSAVPSGYVGQVASSDVPSPGSSVTSGSIANVTSSSIPAGNWMCYGNVQQIPGASTAIGQNAAWISTTSAALPSALEASGYAKRVTVASSTAALEGLNVGPVFYSFTASTTVYLSSQVNYSSGTTGTQYGALNCVRFH